MHHVRQKKLPFVGSSHEFVGADQGDTGISVFLFHGKPGSGPGLHRHPYDEIQSFAGARRMDGQRPDLRRRRWRYLCHQGGRDPQLQSDW